MTQLTQEQHKQAIENLFKKTLHDALQESIETMKKYVYAAGLSGFFVGLITGMLIK